MSRAGRFLAGAGLAAGYVWSMLRRNERLEPPPVRDGGGEPFPERRFIFSDGAEVALVDTSERGGPGSEEGAGTSDRGERAGAGPEPEGRGEQGRPQAEVPACLMVPGADGVKETFRYQIPAFGRRFRVVAADMRSTFPPGATFQRLAEDLRELVEGLDTGPVVVVGQSLGGAVALRFASTHPELVRALVVCNSLTRVSYEHVGLDRSALAPLAMATTRYLPTGLGKLAARFWARHEVWIFDDSPGRENLVEYAFHTGPRAVSPRVSSRRVDLLRGLDLRPELERISAPTLVVKGPRDAYCPPEWSKEIAAGVPGAAYVEIPMTGHCSHISRPGGFNRAVLRWLAGVLPAREEQPAG